ncbi:FapA family protein [Clostridium botulinum]|uniref:FapA family protein n=1 Tax=Clostridium botulinum TaxID=1491 RepID=UPI0022450B6D|nr:FapA family protein [Clostridium botulinum]UZP05045.1 FapA family protein [Clostridium botulinum]UZP08455.1 FapA family protein [Clostridium botulinum]UZP11783.1 FapA family protein [Clostridium botulinum]
MNLLFYGLTLDECLKSACKELNIHKDKIDYEIVKKTSFFNKTMVIKVKFNFDKKDNLNNISDFDDAKDNILSSKANNINEEINEINDSSIQVENGKIIVKGKGNLTIRSCKGITLYINGQCCERGKFYSVSEDDKVEHKNKIISSDRKMNLNISKDRMSVYISIEYVPEYEYELIDSKASKSLTLRSRKKIKKECEKYTVKDILTALIQFKVSHGIIYEEIVKVCNGTNNEEIVIVKGSLPIDDKEDEIKIYFDTAEKNILDENDVNQKVDYKNLKSFSNVNEGVILAERILGYSGKNGKDIFGKQIKRKIARNKPLKVGRGCKIENNKVISTKVGRPMVQNGIFTVNTLYSVNDVDIKSGNVNFIGDVEVNGAVQDGMKVFCKGSLTVKKDITSANVKVKGYIDVKGNVINSIVLAGGYDLEKNIYLDNLKKYYTELEGLTLSLRKLLLKSPHRKLGELIKILIENRYKSIPKLSMDILAYNIASGYQNEEVLDFIRNKIIGLNNYNIVSIGELDTFIEIVKEELEYLGDDFEIPVDVNLKYTQNSNIICTGNIIITGNGSYISTLRAFNTIEFLMPNSVVRGGSLTSKKALILKNVGSESGVITKLQVDNDGIITANTAYNGTMFCFGRKKRLLKESGRNIKAYLNKDGQIEIEMFKL